MNIQSIIDDLALVNGQSKRMTCPACNTKNTFTITNNMGRSYGTVIKLGAVRQVAHVLN